MIAGVRQIDGIVDAVSDYSGFSRDELMKPYGSKPLQFYRALTIWICCKHAGWGPTAVAEYFSREWKNISWAKARIEADPEAVALGARLWKETVIYTEAKVVGDTFDDLGER